VYSRSPPLKHLFYLEAKVSKGLGDAERFRESLLRRTAATAGTGIATGVCGLSVRRSRRAATRDIALSKDRSWYV
jgi:hypothetical protein